MVSAEKLSFRLVAQMAACIDLMYHPCALYSVIADIHENIDATKIAATASHQENTVPQLEPFNCC